jgi:hypothetical protein
MREEDDKRREAELRAAVSYRDKDERASRAAQCICHYSVTSVCTVRPPASSSLGPVPCAALQGYAPHHKPEEPVWSSGPLHMTPPYVLPVLTHMPPGYLSQPLINLSLHPPAQEFAALVAGGAWCPATLRSWTTR